MPTVFLSAQGKSFPCAKDERFLDAANRAGFRLPVSCKNGVCEICQAQLIEGRAWQGRATRITKHATRAASEDILLCHSGPETDCMIYIENVFSPGELPVKKFVCQIEEVTEMQAHVFRVRLKVPAGRLPEFYAGQYLSLDLPERDDAHYFSIASAPGQRDIELHIQADPHIEAAVETVNFLRQERLVKISLPFGKSCLHAIPQQPIILLAAGTGFAQMKSLIEFLWQNDFKLPVHLYWTVRKASDLYAENLAEDWAAQYANFSFSKLIGEAQDEQCTEHHEGLAEAVLADALPLKTAKIFVSGSPKLVFSVKHRLVQAGMPEPAFYSDVLEYAKPEDFGF